MFLGNGKDALDLFRRHERTGGVMDRDVARIGVENIQARANGILPVAAAGNDVTHFLQRGRPNECLQLLQAPGAAD